MNHGIWTRPETFEAHPDRIEQILRSPSFGIQPIDDYLRQIEQATGDDFSVLRAVARDSLPYQAADAHLATRRIIANFFTEKSMSKWRNGLDVAIARSLETLASASDPDLMRDFVNPVFLALITQVVGFRDDGSGALFPMIAQAQRLTEPMLSLRDLRAINTALVRLLDMLPGYDVAKSEAPGSLLDYLGDRNANGPDGTDLRNTALALLLAANSAAQSLGFALYGCLTAEAGQWDDVAAPEWAEKQLDRIISLYPSTLTLVRVAEDDVEVAGCPYARGHAQVMDVVAANATLRAHSAEASRDRTLSFGAGVHKCPGEHLARLMLGAAIPALRQRFPRLMLHKDRAKFLHTPMLQAPVALPCECEGRSGPASARLWDIKDMAVARRIVNNDDDFSPPTMEPHLRALADNSGRDFSQAIRIARNALFFMSGPRHAAARRAIAHSLGGNRIPAWQDVIDAEVGRALDRLAASPKPDLIHDFADPVFRGITRPIFGIDVANTVRFDVLAPTLQDVLEPWLPLRELLRLQEIMDELLAMMRAPDIAAENQRLSVFAALIKADLAEFDADDIKALVLVLYGASFNLAHTLGNILHWLLTRPPETRRDIADPKWLVTRMEALISLCASPKYIYRMARGPVTFDGMDVNARDTVRLQLLSINRGVSEGHLAFGHGLHHCVGAALSRLMLRRAIPALFARFPDISLPPQRHAYSAMSQTVALSSLPCRLNTDKTFPKDPQ